MLLEDVRSVLVVVAHCDDAEWMFGGTLTRLIQAGAAAGYVITTDGSSGGVDLSVSNTELARRRTAEQQAAAEVLGVDDLVFLDHPNDSLSVTVELKRQLVREIRRFRPDLVLTWMPYRDRDASIDWNHGDHIATGEATLQAVYPEALMPRIHPELAEEGLSAHEVTEVWIPAGEDADLYVDVTSVVPTKMDAIWCHQSQNGEANGDREWLFTERVVPPMAQAGARIGVRYAERFRRIPIKS